MVSFSGAMASEAGRDSLDLRLQRATSLSAEALISTGIYSALLKRLTGRPRPDSLMHPSPSLTSFPSGHTMTAFTVATVFAAEYRDRRWVRWLVFGTAGLVAWSRVALDRHYPTDVIAGALLGHSIGRMVSRGASVEHRPGLAAGVRPYYDPWAQGFGLSYRRSW